MKRILFFISFIASSFLSTAQTTATDFNVNDCKGVPHHLFSELDAGKVIVLVWVMPCGSCIGPALSAYNVVQSYTSSYPGKVLYYLVDDYGTTSCTSLSNWGKAYVGANITATFSNSAINMNNYGGAGMPKVVVLAGANDSIYFNQNNTVNTTNLQNAINQAISITGIKEEARASAVNLFPVPASDKMNISYILPENAEVEIEVYNILGERIQRIQMEKQSKGEHMYSLNTSTFSDGIYFLNLNGKTLKFQISN